MKTIFALLTLAASHCAAPARVTNEAKVPGPTVTATCESLEIHGTDLSDTAQVIPSLMDEPSNGQGHPVAGVFDLSLDPSYYVERMGRYNWSVGYHENGALQGFSQSGWVECQ